MGGAAEEVEAAAAAAADEVEAEDLAGRLPSHGEVDFHLIFLTVVVPSLI